MLQSQAGSAGVGSTWTGRRFVLAALRTDGSVVYNGIQIAWW